jgi:hypothetical protein
MSSQEDTLKQERINAINLINSVFIENLNKNDDEIEEYNPILHGDLKIITVIPINNNNNNKN